MSDNNSKSMGDLFPDLGPEAPVISGVAHDRSEALATVRGVPNEPGMAAKVFTELATAGVNVDMIVQAGASVGTAEISFTVPESTSTFLMPRLENSASYASTLSFNATLILSITLWRPFSRMVDRTRPASLRCT